MRFCIADTFPKALARLSAQEQKEVKLTVFDLQLDPARPGLQFHRIERAKDPHFWSMRVNRDIRLIVHKTADSFLICYVDHHDDAYSWAERRRIETHPRTGAAQIVEIRERVEEIIVRQSVGVPAADRLALPLLFAGYGDDELLGYGIPEDWLQDVRAATDDTVLTLAAHLPAEAAEALLCLAVGERPDKPVVANTSPFEHPDALRRFRVFENDEELKQALDAPWEQWAVFLHPSQRQVVSQSFSGPARVTGSAGTGKTVVAIHRAAILYRRESETKLLLTTFSNPLANALSQKLRILIGDEDVNRIVPRVTVLPIKQVAEDLFTLAHGYTPRLASPEQVRMALKAAADTTELSGFTLPFLVSEWLNVVDAWQVETLETYQTVPRIGRKQRLGAKQRERLWPVFEQARRTLDAQGVFTWPAIFGGVTRYFAGRDNKPFTHAIVDEAQDLGVPELRMLKAITPAIPDALFFAGDLGQRIFQEPFSWLAIGVDIRGRSRTLKVNYRTSHQIRRAADRLLPSLVRDADGEEQNRHGTVSVFNGPEPEIRIYDTPDAEIAGIADWIRQTVADGIAPAEVGLFVRSNDQLARARAAVKAAGHEQLELSERMEQPQGRIAIGAMHLAKGLEYKAIAVMSCDEGILPLRERLASAADMEEIKEITETERQLFYVACTRARDRLLATGVKPASEFFADFQNAAFGSE